MDPRFPVSREELYSVQMDMKQLHIVQTNHAERLSRLEKRQADDAALKSVWNSPFPSAIGGTPQHGVYPFSPAQSLSNPHRAGPVQMPPNDIFDDFEEQGQNLLGSLHLDAEEEPARRGAASRANSVRFDESALQGSSWANSRHSGDFGPIRPSSGMGTMMERSLSHKSDGRHSSAGHSVHSVHSHHSVASGRASSLGLDTNFATTGSDEDSPVGAPEPPPGLSFLGSVPSIVRCWLTPKFAHDTLLYADICTGSQKSVLEYSLVKDLGLVDEVHRDLDGVQRIRIPLYLAEATVVQPSRGSSPGQMPEVPSLVTNFEVIGADQVDTAEPRKSIRIFVGSETLREHSADVLFSQNVMQLYSSEREKLSVPFVRPEDSAVFKNIRTLAAMPEKPKLNATARPFVLSESKTQSSAPGSTNGTEEKESQAEPEVQGMPSPALVQTSKPASDQGPATATASESDAESDGPVKEAPSLSRATGSRDQDVSGDQQSEAASNDTSRRASAAGGIWSSWRMGGAVNGADSKENAPLSGYQPASRARNMKVLKPSKSISSTSSSTARSGAGYEAQQPARPGIEQRRKSQPAAESTHSTAFRWKSERAVAGGAEGKGGSTPSAPREQWSVSNAPRTAANPVGGASAFGWMSKTTTPASAAAE